MLTHWKLSVILVFACAVAGHAQQVCISQDAANKCAELARTVPALEAKIATLEAALIEKDKIGETIKATAAQNEADLRKALHETEVKLATATGQIIKCDAREVRDAAMIEFLVKNQRSKQNGLINIKLGGN